MAKRKFYSKERLLRDDDATLAVMDDALTLAESALRKLLAAHTPRQITLAFEHVQAHLAIELHNVKDHGHAMDDPEDVPDGLGALEAMRRQYWIDCHAAD